MTPIPVVFTAYSAQRIKARRIGKHMLSLGATILRVITFNIVALSHIIKVTADAAEVVAASASMSSMQKRTTTSYHAT
jgi:hypothetical protein